MDRVSDDDDDLAAIKDPLDAGSGSLGGARPEASVRGDDAQLLIAKFSHGGDAWDVLSAMSLLGARDGDEREYLDNADALIEHGAAVTADFAELFRRVVMSVAVPATDDHLRNHGPLRARGGWRLSPVFDVDPDPDPRLRVDDRRRTPTARRAPARW